MQSFKCIISAASFVLLIAIGSSCAQAKPALSVARQQVRQASQLLRAAEQTETVAERIADLFDTADFANDDSGSGSTTAVDRNTRQLDTLTNAIRGIFRFLAIDLGPLTAFFERVAPEIRDYLRFARRFCIEWPRFTDLQRYGQLTRILDATCGSRLFRIQPSPAGEADSSLRLTNEIDDFGPVDSESSTLQPQEPTTVGEAGYSGEQLTPPVSEVKATELPVSEDFTLYHSSVETTKSSTEEPASPVPAEESIAGEPEVLESTTTIDPETASMSTMTTIEEERQTDSTEADTATTQSATGTRKQDQQGSMIRVYIDEHGVIHIVRPGGMAPAQIIQHTLSDSANVAPFGVAPPPAA